MVGYLECSKAYGVYTATNNEVFESLDVVILNEGSANQEVLADRPDSSD
jgi:hypothetical protein